MAACRGNRAGVRHAPRRPRRVPPRARVVRPRGGARHSGAHGAPLSHGQCGLVGQARAGGAFRLHRARRGRSRRRRPRRDRARPVVGRGGRHDGELRGEGGAGAGRRRGRRDQLPDRGCRGQDQGIRSRRSRLHRRGRLGHQRRDRPGRPRGQRHRRRHHQAGHRTDYFQFVLVYTVPPVAKSAAVEDVAAAVADEALRVGEETGLPLHRFPLARIREAQSAVEEGVTGKVLVDVSEPS